jgi:hypothetical protein
MQVFDRAMLGIVSFIWLNCPELGLLFSMTEKLRLHIAECVIAIPLYTPVCMELISIPIHSSVSCA